MIPNDLSRCLSLTLSNCVVCFIKVQLWSVQRLNDDPTWGFWSWDLRIRCADVLGLPRQVALIGSDVFFCLRLAYVVARKLCPSTSCEALSWLLVGRGTAVFDRRPSVYWMREQAINGQWFKRLTQSHSALWKCRYVTHEEPIKQWL